VAGVATGSAWGRQHARRTTLGFHEVFADELLELFVAATLPM
jgi:hypothetical protein